jgi:hypothetical protein
MNEPDIAINGQRLTVAQAMTVRCALENFAMELQTNGLGDDMHGKAMTAGYLSAIYEIRGIIFR